MLRPKRAVTRPALPAQFSFVPPRHPHKSPRLSSVLCITYLLTRQTISSVMSDKPSYWLSQATHLAILEDRPLTLIDTHNMNSSSLLPLLSFPSDRDHPWCFYYNHLGLGLALSFGIRVGCRTSDVGPPKERRNDGCLSRAPRQSRQ